MPTMLEDFAVYMVFSPVAITLIGVVFWATRLRAHS